MSNYTINVDWDGKDALSDSSAAKVISGDDFQTEFETVQTAVNSKANLNGDAAEQFSCTTQGSSENSTKVASTAYVTTAVAALDGAAINALVYPVGSLYFNMAVSTNPYTLLGVGTWVAYAEGQVLVGFESSGTFDALDESLGAETASAATSGSTTLSTSQIPSHSHKVAGGEHATGSYDNGDNWTTNNLTSVSTARAYQVDTSSVGGGTGHTHTTPAVSTLQPSKTLYIWKRTA